MAVEIKGYQIWWITEVNIDFARLKRDMRMHSKTNARRR